MSISAGLIAAAVMGIRFIFRKVAPKRLICFLWLFVAIRLICPFTIESDFSIMPATAPIPTSVIGSNTSARDNAQDENDFTVTVTGTQGVSSQEAGTQEAENESIKDNSVVNGTATEPATPLTQQPDITENSKISVGSIALIIWGIGCAAMLVYMAISYIKLSAKVRICVKTDINVYFTDGIATSFILGAIKPKIYIPSNIAEANAKYILSHEKSHIKRLDHIWKLPGYLLLSVNWFNPIIWLSYALLCKDIEMACDEKVASRLSIEEIKEYSRVLLRCSVPKHMITACPLAFGENSVKERIKAMKHNKKFTVLAVAAFALICAVCTVCLLTNPKANANKNDNADSDTMPKSDSAGNIVQPSDNVTSSDAAQGGINSKLPLEDGANLYSDKSYAQVTADTDGDGLQDRITYAFLSSKTSYICVEYGNATKENVAITLKGGVKQPKLLYSFADDNTLIYLTNKSNDKNVYPFAILSSGEITPIINKNAKKLSQNSILSHSSFISDSFGKLENNNLIITYGKPYILVELPSDTLKGADMDALGLWFSYKDSVAKVSTKNNTIQCNVDCVVSEKATGTSYASIKATLKFSYQGGVFKLKNIEFKTDYNTKLLTADQQPQPTPSPTKQPQPTPQPTSTPVASETTYAKTIVLSGIFTKKIDLDGDGKQETIECKGVESPHDDSFSEYESVTIISSTGKTLYTNEYICFREVHIADITDDGRLAVFIVDNRDSFDSVSAFFVAGESINTIYIYKRL